jgi:5S rRNA maturation endonuclease (ribonuclease M5)
VLLHCFAGCACDEILSAVGLTKRDLFPRRASGNQERLGRIVATYDYVDENGKLLFQSVRYVPKDFRQRRPDGRGGWIWNLREVRLVLYRLPDVLASQTVVVTEGEKDADRMTALGFTATTNPLGAGKWCDDYSDTLRGKDVVIFRDNDEQGEKHVAQVIGSLRGKARSIKLVILLDGFHDVSDYIASLPKKERKAAIQNLIDATPLWNFVDVDANAIELPPAPAPFAPPPLSLLPTALQDFVHAAAESLNVDHSYIFLPLLAAIGTAIGNSRSALLKRGFIQAPNIWTAIIGRSGSLKSPSIETACFAIMEHERELDRQNRQAKEKYSEDLAQWESQKKPLRGDKPDPPVILTCQMDDLTLEALATRLEPPNRRGILVAKDELSHWFESFDQYRNQKGSDVSRWCSLHTGVQFGIDRRTDNRHQRLWLPRICITGGIQSKVLKRLLTEDFFERGLPARFIFAAPPFRQVRWTDAIISDDLMQRVRKLFEELWLLQPEKDDHGQPAPVLLRLSGEAREQYIDFFNECGETGAESDEREAAAWSKLTGYAARFALLGQVLCDQAAEKITGEIMSSACDLARWSGNEAVRVYGQFSETKEEREQRELVEFVQRRGGEVTVRETMMNFWPLKNQRDEIEKRFDALVKTGRGKWIERCPAGRGRPSRVFQLSLVSTSTQISIFRGETANCVDVDATSPPEILRPARNL